MFSLAFLLCIYITKLPNNYNAVLVRKESRTLVYWTSNYGIIYFALILTTLTNDFSPTNMCQSSTDNVNNQCKITPPGTIFTGVIYFCVIFVLSVS